MFIGWVGCVCGFFWTAKMQLLSWFWGTWSYEDSGWYQSWLNFFVGQPRQAHRPPCSGEQIWLGELYTETRQSMQQFWNGSADLDMCDSCCHVVYWNSLVKKMMCTKFEHFTGTSFSVFKHSGQPVSHDTFGWTVSERLKGAPCFSCTWGDNVTANNLKVQAAKKFFEKKFGVACRSFGNLSTKPRTIAHLLGWKYVKFIILPFCY